MRKIIIIILSCLILNTFGFSTGNDTESFQAKYYDNAKLLRVKFVEGEAFVKRSYDDGYEEATINLSIFEKDSVGTTEGRLEIYLGRLNYVRLDFDTEVEFNRVPELKKTNTAIMVRKGGVYLDVENLDFERDIEIQTPDCGVFLLDKGVYRINVNEDGATEVFVYEGMAEVSGKDYSRNVRESQKTVMSDGSVRERPFFFYASDSDGFDKWNQKRKTDVGYARYSTSRYLDSGYEDYEYELSRNGRWVYNSSYREHIWIPYNIGGDWSPYSQGRWVWSPFYGYVWNSYDSWGYFTHHYGRWHWDSYYGWHWYAGYHWSPGWVYWSWDDNYYGWCPLSRWNRPIVILNKRWMKDYDYRKGIPIHSRATVIIKKNQLNSSHIGKVALKRNLLKNGTIGGKGFAPKLRPSIDRIKVINARGKTVEYKKNGFRIGKKYQAVKSPADSSGVKKDAVYKYSKTKDSPSKNAFKYSKRSKTEVSSTTYKSGEVKKSEVKKSEVKRSEVKRSEVKRSEVKRSEVKKKTYSGTSGKYKSSTGKSQTKYQPKKSSTKASSTKAKYQSRSSSKASSKSSTKSSARSKSSKSSSGKTTKVKKKDSSPSYSSYPSRSNSYSSESPSSSYRSSYKGDKKSPVKSTRSTSYYDYSTSSYSSNKPSTRYNYKSSGSSSPPESRSYSSSSSSYKSNSQPSYKSPSGSSSKSYSSPRTSSGSSRSYNRSSSRSSSSRSVSRSSSSGSSSSRSSSVKSSSKKK